MVYGNCKHTDMLKLEIRAPDIYFCILSNNNVSVSGIKYMQIRQYIVMRTSDIHSSQFFLNIMRRDDVKYNESIDLGVILGIIYRTLMILLVYISAYSFLSNFYINECMYYLHGTIYSIYYLIKYECLNINSGTICVYNVFRVDNFY